MLLKHTLGASLPKSPSCCPVPAFGTSEGQLEATGFAEQRCPQGSKTQTKLQTRGFINTEEDHSIKREELEDLEELGKSEGE